MGQDPKIALVTGGNRGIGYEVVIGLAKAGYSVLLGARDGEKGRGAAAMLSSVGYSVQSVQLDVSKSEDIYKVADHIGTSNGRLDVLVNNAAIGLDFTQPSDVLSSSLREILNTNLFGSIELIQRLLPLLHKSDCGRIVNVSSDFGSITLNADPKQYHSRSISLAYPISKAALNMATVQFAKELRSSKVCINAVNPGFTDTEMISGMGVKAGRTAAEAAVPIVKYATWLDGCPNGGFFDEAGEVPW